jgi:hypothetical protein
VEEYLCPDIDKESMGRYTIQNKYTDVHGRKSFSMEAVVCNSTRNIECKNTSEINNFLSTFYFTLNTLQQRAELTNMNFGNSPLKT